MGTDTALEANLRISIIGFSQSRVYQELLSESPISHDRTLAGPRSLVLHSERKIQPLALVATIHIRITKPKITNKFDMEIASTKNPTKVTIHGGNTVLDAYVMHSILKFMCGSDLK